MMNLKEQIAIEFYITHFQLLNPLVSREKIVEIWEREGKSNPYHSSILFSDQILSLILKEIEGVENPYAFQDGTAIPKWEKMFNAFEECRIAVKKVINAD